VEPVSDFIAAGDQALVRFIWHTAGQGPESRWEFIHVATVRDGRIIHNEYHWDHSHALEAVGVAERPSD
jgi:ketosteroid isomerase-like protein